jgi:hypothetical protein
MCSLRALLFISIATSGCGSAKAVDLFSASSAGGVGQTSGGTGGSSVPLGVSSDEMGGSSDGTGGTSVGGQTPASGGANVGGGASTPVTMAAGAPSGGASSAGLGGSASTGATASVAGRGGAEASGAGGNGSATCAGNATEICDGSDNDCDGSIDEGACPAACTGFVVEGEGYMACKTSTEQTKAAELCAGQGMRLVWIESQAQDASLLGALMQLDASLGVAQSSFFIGASDTPREGRWHWIDGAEFWSGDAEGMPLGKAYVHWAAGRPNGGASENCSVILLNAPDKGLPGEWNDSPCNELHGALCQTP